jgi:hypothetical protein
MFIVLRDPAPQKPAYPKGVKPTDWTQTMSIGLAENIFVVFNFFQKAAKKNPPA